MIVFPSAQKYTFYLHDFFCAPRIREHRSHCLAVKKVRVVSTRSYRSVIFSTKPEKYIFGKIIKIGRCFVCRGGQPRGKIIQIFQAPCTIKQITAIVLQERINFYSNECLTAPTWSIVEAFYGYFLTFFSLFRRLRRSRRVELAPLKICRLLKY